MGLWGFIKSLFGFKEKPKQSQPFYITHGEQDSPSREHWDKAKKKLDDQLEWARIKRSRYG